MPTLQRVAIVIDYQNVHMTAHDVFMPAEPIHKALIDPYRFSKRLIEIKNEDIKISNDQKGLELPMCKLSRIEVFRGIPVPEADNNGYRRNLLQKNRWEKEACINNIDLHITYRSLKYRTRIENGHTHINSTFPPQEKGIDVLCALALTRLARAGSYDCVILASRDTDLSPALDEAHRSGTRVEAVKWYSPSASYTRGNISVNKTWKLWTTSMGEVDFRVCIDPYDYS